METWMVWTIVAAIGLVVGLIIHALVKQAQGSALLGTLLISIAGAFLGAWLLTRIVDIGAMTLTEERFLWAVVGSAVLALLYELASAGQRTSRILVPVRGR